jgi:exodeoxyribonuclease VII small subunit
VARTKKGSSGKPVHAEGVHPDQVVERAPDVDADDADDAMGIDEILDGLEAVVAQLEAGDLPLEEALRRFEHGVGLARRGSSLLDAVEERVEQLLADRDEAVPMNDESTEEDR